MIRSIAVERLYGLLNAAVGLTPEQVEARAAQFGANRIVEVARGGGWQLLAETLKDPMLWFLLGTSVLFVLVGQSSEALILFVALFPLLGMDAWLHRRTRASTASLSGRLAETAQVMRGDQRVTVAATDLVPGDLVLVETGESFPADGVLVGGAAVQVDESMLTGESFPVRKQILAALPPGDPAPVEHEHWCLAGTRLLSGSARIRLACTGAETLYGEIVQSATRGAQTRTPLQSAVASLVGILIVGATLLCLMLAWARVQQGHGWLDALLSAVTLAIAALPEEFPVVLTFFLGVGVYRLARRQALVRRAVVVENIGRVTCICSDKTGTITEGRLTLAHCFPAAGLSDDRLLQLAIAASRRETGDPLDRALIGAAGEAQACEAVACFPFTEDRKRETGIVRDNGELLAAVKGAPEVVLGLCAMEEGARRDWLKRVEQLAASGHKVIACAWQPLASAGWRGGEPDRDFRFAGLLALEDPVRAGVPEAVHACRAARIHVVLVTGDHPATARAVAREIGLGGESPRVINGDELETLLAREDRASLREIAIVARAVPAQKLMLVRALQASGEIVAVTGDGVNDVPALQAADIGIAMGGRGTRSAREVAAIVLLDDNFRSIVRAIAEGRQLFTSLRLSYQYLLMIHIPLVLTATFIPFAGYPLLYLPIHVVWLELIIHPTALLVFQSLPPPEQLAPARRNGVLRFFSKGEWAVIVAVGLLITAVIAFTYLRSLGAGYDVEHARAMALVALMVASAGITAHLSGLRSRLARVVVALSLTTPLVLVQVPWLAAWLHLAPLHLDDWLLALAGGAVASLLAAWRPGTPDRVRNEA